MLYSEFMPRPGTAISVGVGPFRHVGIAPGGGRVISCSRRAGEVREESIQEFCGDRDWRTERLRTDLSPDVVIARARSRSGQSYNLFAWNCEHFARWAMGLPAKSPQLRGWVTAAGIAGALVLASAKRTPTRSC